MYRLCTGILFAASITRIVIAALSDNEELIVSFEKPSRIGREQTRVPHTLALAEITQFLQKSRARLRARVMFDFMGELNFA